MNRRSLLIAAVLTVATTTTGLFSSTADAANFGRQRYASWSYYPTSNYYYRSYYYKPYDAYAGYKYHYNIYYPSRPQYVYYYNPYQKVYWGRYDLEAKGYSLLAEGDRKEKLEDIAESAFPKPGKMPAIPESEGDEPILEPDPNDLPKTDAPQDVPAGN